MSEPSKNNPDPALVMILGEIKGQLGTYIDVMKGLQDNHKNLDNRVRGLENAKFWIMGAAAAIGAVAGFVADLLSNGGLK